MNLTKHEQIINVRERMGSSNAWQSKVFQNKEVYLGIKARNYSLPDLLKS